MATSAQIQRILDRIDRTRPAVFLNQMDEAKSGMIAVLRVLHEAQAPVSAGRICKALNVSTARVAVLLKKMENKGLITKLRDALDARLTLVQLSDLGTEMVSMLHAKRNQQIGVLIDAIGEERLLNFFDTADEIQSAVSPPELPL